MPVARTVHSHELPDEVVVPPPPLPPRDQWHEPQWSKHLAKEMHGVAEFKTPDGSRVDILTAEYAWEVEWADKHWESTGQAVYYGLATNRKAGVILLLRKKNGAHNDKLYYTRCLAVCTKIGIKLIVVDTTD